MPNRILREGILTSERVDALSAPAEVFYRRLHSVVDDFGRYYAKPELLLAATYPLRITKIRLADIATWLGNIRDAGLVRTYRVDGKDYLELLDFRQQVRAKASRFPDPPSACAADATQAIGTRAADAHLDVDVSVVVSEDDIASRDQARSAAGPPVNGNAVAYIPLADGTDFGVSKDFLAELEQAYPRVDGPQTLKEIRVWCISNPANRKTRKGAPRFINRWFERVQNDGR